MVLNMFIDFKIPVLVSCLGLLLFTSVGCGEQSDERISEDRARKIERDIDQELEHAGDEIRDLGDRLEDKLDQHLTEEELDKITQEIESTLESGIASIGESLERIGKRLKEDSKVTVVDYRDFKELLPDRMQEFKLTNIGGSNKSGFGMRLSKLEADYENESNDAQMEIAILDLGTMKGITSLGFDWIDNEIDNEDINGFEKTTKFGGYPGFKSAEYEGPNVKTHGVAIVEDRFVVSVNVQGRNLDKDILEKVFSEFSFRRLRRMAD